MEFLSRFNKIFFSQLILSTALLLAQNVFAADDLKPACYRIEGTKMSCTGGGGVGQACGETCAGKFPNAGNTCSDKTVGNICEGIGVPTPCMGTKCCDTCDRHVGEHCGTFFVCGQKCTGSTQIDCSKQSCQYPEYGTGGIAKYEQVQIGCTPGFSCAAPIKAGDGCVCTCQQTDTECVAKDNGFCTKCSCGKNGFCTPNFKTVCTQDKNVKCIGGYKTVPMVNDGPCACKCPIPSGVPAPSTPRCSSC